MTWTPGERELVEAACADAHRTSTGWLRATCPFCMMRVGVSDHRRSLSVLPGKWFYRCWRCHATGRLLQAPDGTQHLTQQTVDTSSFDLGPPDTFMPLAEGEGATAMCTAAARAYLAGRGVSRHTCAEAGIGVCLHGRAAGRIVVPVYAPGTAEWRGWVGRAWDKRVELRYVYPPGMPRGELLFNADALLVQTDLPIFVVEGVFDALPHWPDACSCLGKPTEGQVQLMLRARRPVLVALDGDAWTEGEALSLRLQLEGLTAAALHLPPCTDPGNYKTTELRRLAVAQGKQLTIDGCSARSGRGTGEDPGDCQSHTRGA
jgi:hypothetical protein